MAEPRCSVCGSELRWVLNYRSGEKVWECPHCANGAASRRTAAAAREPSPSTRQPPPSAHDSHLECDLGFGAEVAAGTAEEWKCKCGTLVKGADLCPKCHRLRRETVEPRDKVGFWKRLFSSKSTPAAHAKRAGKLGGAAGLHEEVMTFVTRGVGDPDRLKLLIKQCKADPQGLSILSDAHRNCNQQRPVWSRALHEAIKELQLTSASASTSEIVWQVGEHVPADLRDEISKFVMDPTGADRLKKLIDRCKTYSDGQSALSEARRFWGSRWKEGFHRALRKDLDDAITAWKSPQIKISAGTIRARSAFENHMRRLRPELGRDADSLALLTKISDAFDRSSTTTGQAIDMLPFDGPAHFSSIYADLNLKLDVTVFRSPAENAYTYFAKFGGYLEWLGNEANALNQEKSETQRQVQVFIHLAFVIDPNTGQIFAHLGVAPNGRQNQSPVNVLPTDLLTKQECKALNQEIGLPKEVTEGVKLWQRAHPQKVKKPLDWSKGQPNPKSKSVARFGRGGPSSGVQFLCPACTTENRVFDKDISDVSGANVSCDVCGTISHVPMAYRMQSDISGLTIHGSVRVPIAEFSDWVFAHPSFLTSDRKHVHPDTEFHGNYGLWGFCAGCRHQYASTVLPTYYSLIPGTRTLFNAHSEKSRQDFDALIEKHCPSCGNPDLLAIMVDVPQYVRDALNIEKKKRGL